MPNTTDPGLTPNAPASDEHPIDALPEDVQTYIRSLRRENAQWRTGKKELQSQLESTSTELAELRKLKEAKAAEQGEFKSLYEEAKPKLETFGQMEAKVKAYDDFFQRSLEAELEQADETIKDLILSSSKPIHERVELAKKLKADRAATPGGDSPIPTRPGGGVKPDADLIARYREAKNPGERARILTEARNSHPKVYPALLALAKGQS